MNINGSFTVSVVDRDFLHDCIAGYVEFVVGGTYGAGSVFVLVFGSDYTCDCVRGATCVFNIIQTSKCYIVASTGLGCVVGCFCLGFHFSPQYILKFVRIKAGFLSDEYFLGKGTGDLYIKGICGIIVSETYSIEDCTYYHESAFTSTQNNFNVPIPSNFEITFYTRRTSSSGNSSYLELGGDTGNTALCGQIGGSGISCVRIYNSEGSSTYTDHSASDTPSGVNALHTWTKNGNNNSYHTQSTTPVTWNDNITHSKIRKLSITSNRIEQLKVKPL